MSAAILEPRGAEAYVCQHSQNSEVSEFIPENAMYLLTRKNGSIKGCRHDTVDHLMFDVIFAMERGNAVRAVIPSMRRGGNK